MGQSDSKGKLGVRLGTLQELFAFNDWARDGLLRSAANLTKDQLDRPFEMGEGSLRKTLNHLYATEWVWLDRWQGRAPTYRVSAEGVEMGPLWEEFRALAGRRNQYLSGLKDSDLPRLLTYVNIKGQTYTFPLGAMMLHVCNHGSHHRAQALNMLRHVGAKLPKPETDYIFMKLECPAGTPCRLDTDTIRSYFRYGDWAIERMFSAAAKLDDEQLDRKFEMGEGTLRSTLAHVCNAEQWWLTNWTKGPGEFFPEVEGVEPMAEINERRRKTRDDRNKFLDAMSDDGLAGEFEATPRPGVLRRFSVGVTMLQLCHHGTHHRAQAVNMLRHVGAPIPAMDLLEMLKT